MFDDKFVWGVASSAYQVEGTDSAGRYRRINEKAVSMYRDMILTMKENGITPYITLFHWEFPQALREKGGWLNEEVADWFGEYAKVVFMHRDFQRRRATGR